MLSPVQHGPGANQVRAFEPLREPADGFAQGTRCCVDFQSAPPREQQTVDVGAQFQRAHFLTLGHLKCARQGLINGIVIACVAAGDRELRRREQAMQFHFVKPLTRVFHKGQRLVRHLAGLFRLAGIQNGLRQQA